MSRFTTAFAFASCLLLAAAASAQCASLKTTGGSAGTTMTMTVRGGASQSPVLLVWGFQAGETNLPLGGLGNLKIGLDLPFFAVYLGQADLLGAVQISTDVPKFTPRFSVKAQAITYGLKLAWPPRIGWCTSNVASVTIGG